ncbi:MAG: polymerase delta subunit [Pseudomonadota bacterium]|jgi:DNA polymerase-3 subunit delta
MAIHISATQLPHHLKKGMSALYVLHGAAPLLTMEAADAIRLAAKAAGYTERTLLQFDAKSDWSGLSLAAGTLSLFGDLRVLDIRIPTGKPGKVGAQTLISLANHLPESTVTLIILPQLEREQFKSAWFNALSTVGVVVESNSISLDQLPNWLIQRALLNGLRLSLDAAQWIALQTEGNLLAAQQELLKLSLLCPAGVVDLATVRDAVLDVARYDMQQFSQALQGGDGIRALRILDSLESEKEALPLIIWQASEVLRMVIKGSIRTQLSFENIANAAYQLACIDREFKGIAIGDGWTRLRFFISLIAN